MKTTIVEVIDSDSNITSTFERFESNGSVSWTQTYGTQTMDYKESVIDNNNVHLYDGKAMVSLTYDPCTMYMHIDAGKRVQMFPGCTLKLIHVIDEETDKVDDNEEIMSLLRSRLALGKERYGHGVRINDDTRQWGTDTDSWETMMMEEALDGMIYAAAQLLRIKRRKNTISSER